MPRENIYCKVCTSSYREDIDELLAIGDACEVVIEEVIPRILTSDMGIGRHELLLHNARHRKWSDDQRGRFPRLYSGDVIRKTDFSQLRPHTDLAYYQDTDIVLIDCNITNCDFPENINLKNTVATHYSYCTHLNPGLIAKGLPECPRHCIHCVGITGEVVIEGRVVAQDIYHYRNKVVE